MLRAIVHKSYIVLNCFASFSKTRIEVTGSRENRAAIKAVYEGRTIWIFFYFFVWPQCFRFLLGLVSTRRLILKDEVIIKTLRTQLESFEQTNHCEINFCVGFALFWLDSWPTETSFIVYLGTHVELNSPTLRGKIQSAEYCHMKVLHNSFRLNDHTEVILFPFHVSSSHDERLACCPVNNISGIKKSAIICNCF